MGTDFASSETFAPVIEVIETKISPSFDAGDADLSFRSSDDVIFNIHSKNLDTHCGGFPPSEFKNGEGEQIYLIEDSETLETLFQFVYPRRQPELLDISFECLCKIAEAAEKYEVFSAMNICHIRMREKARAHPLYVFVHGYKHGYDDLVNLSAPLLPSIPFDEVMMGIPDGLVKPWIKYHTNWRSKIISTFTKEPASFYASPLSYPYPRSIKKRDPSKDGLTDEVLSWALRAFFRNVPQDYSKEAAMNALRTSLSHPGSTDEIGRHASRTVSKEQFESSVKAFQKVLDDNLKEIPSFMTFLSSFPR